MNIDSYHQHEVVDRLHVVICTISDHLEEHPFVEAFPDIKKRIKSAIDFLSDAYQMAGTIELDAK